MFVEESKREETSDGLRHGRIWTNTAAATECGILFPSKRTAKQAHNIPTHMDTTAGKGDGYTGHVYYYYYYI